MIGAGCSKGGTILRAGSLDCAPNTPIIRKSRLMELAQASRRDTTLPGAGRHTRAKSDFNWYPATAISQFFA
jgi:hypothetical protein